MFVGNSIKQKLQELAELLPAGQPVCPVDHDHDARYYTQAQVDGMVGDGGGFSGDYNDLTNVPQAFAPSSHVHDYGDLTGTPQAFAPSPHDHDSRYYTEAEVDALIAGVSAGGCPFPVDSVYISFSAANPSTFWPGTTWAAIGGGRVLTGLDSGQSEFDAVGKTGGAKTHVLSVSEMPAHSHLQDPHTHLQNAHGHTKVASNTAGTSGTSATRGAGTQATITMDNATAVNQNATAVNQNTGGGAAHNNLPPYLVVNMWRRTE